MLAIPGLTYEAIVKKEIAVNEIDKFFTPDMLDKLAISSYIGAFLALCFAAVLILALFISALFPRPIGRTSYYIERKPGPAFLWGLLMIALIFPGFVLLVASLIGIAFIPAYIILLAAALFFGGVSVAQLVGKKVLKAARIKNKPMLIEVTVGFAVFVLIDLIPIVGCLIKGIAVACGLGAVYATRFGLND